jgi:predicted nucleic acid-binding protein
VTLCDAGPMVALVDADDPYHRQCLPTAAVLQPSMITTWPCLTEAMHLLFRAGGLSAQNDLWAFVTNGVLRLHLPGDDEWHRIRELMNRYADMPLDLADASLLSAAESLNDLQLFSVDESLRAVQLRNGRYLELVP